MISENLAEVSVEKQKKFLDSFKYVLSDMDGVIWLLFKPIEGAVECCKNLEQIGKTLVYVTNNNLSHIETTRSKLKDSDFPCENLISPGVVIVDYLKSIKFNKTVFSLSTPAFQEELRKAGFTVAEDPPIFIKDAYEFLKNIKDDPNVGAVIFEGDYNTSRLKLQKAITYLKRPDCLFIAGACDNILNIGVQLIGNAHFYQVLTDFTGREALQLAKPSKEFAKLVMDKFGIEQENDVLFVGDSVDSDLSFATNAGFKKLLVLTGNTSLEDLQNWKYPEEYKPEYYVNSLDDLRKIIQNIYK